MEVLQDEEKVSKNKEKEKKSRGSFYEYRNSHPMGFLRISLTLLDNGKPLGINTLSLHGAFTIIGLPSLYISPPVMHVNTPPFTFCISQNNFIQSNLL